jgi:general stress protein 26
MPEFDMTDLIAYVQANRLGAISTIGPDGAPQSALVGIGVARDASVIFDTTSETRKHANLTRDRRIALVIGGPDEQTLQLEGQAVPVSKTGDDDRTWREAYYQSWPDGRDRLRWASLVYWRIAPRWARYSDFNRGPLIKEFSWP